MSLISLYLLSLYLGSQARLGPILLCNILVLPALTSALANALRATATPNAAPKTLLALTYLGCMLIQILLLATGTSEGSAAKTFYLLHSITAVVLTISPNQSCDVNTLKRTLRIGIYASFWICFLQLIYILTGISKLEFLMQSEIHEQWLITGSFGNPNNLATVIFLSSIGLMFLERDGKTTGGDKRSRLAHLLSFVLIVATLSRTALALYILVIAYYYRRSLTSPRGAGFVLALTISAALVNSTASDIQTNIVAIDRITSRISSIGESNGSSGDESVGLRWSAYQRFADNFSYLPFGLGFNNYGEFFGGMRGNLYFLNESPHSYFGELILAFGLIGILLTTLYLYTLASFWAINRKAGTIPYLLLFILISFVPSSMMLTPAAIFLSYLPLLNPSSQIRTSK